MKESYQTNRPVALAVDKAPAEVVHMRPPDRYQNKLYLESRGPPEERVGIVDRHEWRKRNIFFCYALSVLQESEEKVKKNSILMKTRLSRRMMRSIGYSKGVSKTLTFICPLHSGEDVHSARVAWGSHELLPRVSPSGACCHVPAIRYILL